VGTAVSASASAATVGMGQVASGAISGMAAGAAAGMVGGFTGAMVSNAFGVSNTDPMKAGLIGAGMGAAIGGATGAIGGAIQTRMQAAQARKNYWNSFTACDE